MIDPYFESRIENWARSNRQGYRPQKSPTLVIMEMLHLQNGDPEGDECEGGKKDRTLPKPDETDARILDAAYRSCLMPTFAKNIIRLYYVSRLPPAVIEKRLFIGRRSFFIHLENAVKTFQRVVESSELKQIMLESS